MAWFSINFVIEFIAFAIITPPIVFALKKAHLVNDGKVINKKDILDAEAKPQAETADVVLDENTQKGE